MSKPEFRAALRPSLAQRAVPLKVICSEYTYSDEVCWSLQDAMQVVSSLSSGDVVIQGAVIYQALDDDARPVCHAAQCWTHEEQSETLEEFRSRSHQRVIDFLNDIADDFKDNWRVILYWAVWGKQADWIPPQ